MKKSGGNFGLKITTMIYFFRLKAFDFFQNSSIEKLGPEMQISIEKFLNKREFLSFRLASKLLYAGSKYRKELNAIAEFKADLEKEINQISYFAFIDFAKLRFHTLCLLGEINVILGSMAADYFLHQRIETMADIRNQMYGITFPIDPWGDYSNCGNLVSEDGNSCVDVSDPICQPNCDLLEENRNALVGLGFAVAISSPFAFVFIFLLFLHIEKITKEIVKGIGNRDSKLYNLPLSNFSNELQRGAKTIADLSSFAENVDPLKMTESADRALRWMNTRESALLKVNLRNTFHYTERTHLQIEEIKEAPSNSAQPKA